MQIDKINKYFLFIAFIFLSANYFLYSNQSKNEFFNAIDRGDAKTINSLISNGININTKDDNGWSALHRAVLANKLDSINTLVANKNINLEATLPKGAKLKTSDKKIWYADGQTPLHLAAFNGYTNAIRMLINRGANILARDSVDYAMPIHIAAAQGQNDSIKYLLDSEIANEENADLVNSIDGGGITPLMYSSIYGKIPSIIYLINAGADPNISDYDGWRALHYAAATGNYDAIKTLLNAGARANVFNDAGNTPYDLAKEEPIQDLLYRNMY